MYQTQNFAPLTPEPAATLPPADLWWRTRRDWRRWGPYAIAIAGNGWMVGNPYPTLQLLAVPKCLPYLGVLPEQLGFGPGWAVYGMQDDPRWVVFSRPLNPDGSLDLRHLPTPPSGAPLAWHQYRYRGLPSL